MIEIVNIGLINYEDGLNIMKDFHKKAVENDKNYLLICQHYDVYTVGQNEDKNFPVSVIKTDRGRVYNVPRTRSADLLFYL
jgi:Lipoate-protein ligase B